MCAVNRGNGAPGDEAAERRAPRGRPRRLFLIAAGFLPIAAYVVLERVLHSEGYALAITATLGVAWALAAGVRQGRVNPIIVATVIVLAIALAVTVASGGSALPLKLRKAVITGSLGLACLISVAIDRPLLPALLELLARGAPRTASGRLQALRATVSERQATGMTVIVGLTLLTDAAIQITLSFAVSTTVFVAVSGLARLAVVAVGLTACGLYWRAGRDARGIRAS